MNVLFKFLFILFLSITLVGSSAYSGEGEVVSINNKTFFIPEAVMRTGFISVEQESRLSFWLDANTVALPSVNVKKFSSEEKRGGFVKIQLLNSYKSEQSAKPWVTAQQKKAKDGRGKKCAMHVVDGVEYDFCSYATEEKDLQSTYHIIEKSTGSVMTVLRCTDMERYTPHNPLCSARAVIFKDIMLHYYFRTVYFNKAVEIDHAIRNTLHQFHDSQKE